MSIDISKNTEELLKHVIDAGGFASAEDALFASLELYLAGEMIRSPSEIDAAISEAEDSIDRGEGIPSDVFLARLIERRKNALS